MLQCWRQPCVRSSLVVLNDHLKPTSAAAGRFTNPMYVSELEAKLEAAEQRIAELDAVPMAARQAMTAGDAEGE